MEAPNLTVTRSVRAKLTFWSREQMECKRRLLNDEIAVGLACRVNDAAVNTLANLLDTLERDNFNRPSPSPLVQRKLPYGPGGPVAVPGFQKGECDLL